jgi:hypothetical protein
VAPPPPASLSPRHPDSGPATLGPRHSHASYPGPRIWAPCGSQFRIEHIKSLWRPQSWDTLVSGNTLGYVNTRVGRQGPAWCAYKLSGQWHERCLGLSCHDKGSRSHTRQGPSHIMKSAVLFLGFTAVAVQAISRLGAEPRGLQAAKPYWYETIKHNGVNPVVANPKNWTIFRNVRDYGAKGDGTTDDTAAIQKAINYPDRGGSKYGTTGAPAVIYFPPGTYIVNSGFRNFVSTSWIGDPTNRPVLKAGPSFTGTVMINAADPTYGSLVGFYQEFKNLILDSTAVAPTKAITLITWGISEATQLSNVLFNMPVGATAHTGIGQSGTNQPLYLNDLTFVGGGTGCICAALQFHFKNMAFKSGLIPYCPLFYTFLS